MKDKNVLIAILGESGSGKTTLKNTLIKDYGFKNVVTYTTRPKRETEVNGIDYHFITKNKFKELFAKESFFETSGYNGWYYGTSKESIVKDGKNVVVLTPSGIRKMKKYLKDKNINISIYVVYINIPRRDRLIKLLERGDDIEESYRRNLCDVGQFDGITNECDIMLRNPKYIFSPKYLAEYLLNHIK